MASFDIESAEHLELLRRYEPMLCFTRGETFFPMDAARYVERCSLWLKTPGALPTCLIPEGNLSLSVLGEPREAPQGSRFFLKFVEPKPLATLARERLVRTLRPDADRFVPGHGRLTTVGYTARLVDAFFSLSLLLRGRVPGDAADAARDEYRAILAADERYCYYGRVIQQGTWKVLQYWYFYAYNNWRSGFFGANDHEADWEMVAIYLAPGDDDGWHPEWIAVTMHDAHGDDLRRRWDDPIVEKVGTHPLLYVAAGSHALYFQKGEYLSQIEIPALRPLSTRLNRLRRLWHERLLTYGVPLDETASSPSTLLRIPFIDYARGDGITLGANGDRPWEIPVLIGDQTPWVRHYHGLWGLYVQDPFAGENAPAGPMYNRDGTMRLSWHDPLAWAGLNKVVPRATLADAIQSHRAEIQQEQNRLRQKKRTLEATLRDLEIERVATQCQPHLADRAQHVQAEIERITAEVEAVRARLAQNEQTLDALGLYAAKVQDAQHPSKDTHLRHPPQPLTPQDIRFTRIAELWATISASLIFLIGVSLFFLPRSWWLPAILLAMLTFVLVESLFRRRLTRTISAISLALASLATVVIVLEFFPSIVMLMLVAFSLYILRQNIRERFGV